MLAIETRKAEPFLWKIETANLEILKRLIIIKKEILDRRVLLRGFGGGGGWFASSL